MGQQLPELTDRLIEFIENQKIFFVGTAADTGTINLSPKGGNFLKVTGVKEIAWLNLTGSGNESSAHVLLNPRMTLMFCAFDGAPLIIRAYGEARALHRKDAEWDDYISLFPQTVAARQIFVLTISMVQSSCGMSVPYFDYKSDRHDLTRWSEHKGTEGIEKYWASRNQLSIDGFATEIVERSGIDQSS